MSVFGTPSTSLLDGSHNRFDGVLLSGKATFPLRQTD
jgi:hypothetical protein